jgi:hypothetical protein
MIFIMKFFAEILLKNAEKTFIIYLLFERLHYDIKLIVYVIKLKDYDLKFRVYVKKLKDYDLKFRV